MTNFEGKTVIVTGGTRGIGKGIAKSFLKAGANVIATYVGNDEAAQSFKTELSEYSEKLEVKKFNVANSAEVEDFYKYAEDRFGEIHILVNNSGIRRDNLLVMMEDSQWESVLDTNLKGTFLMTKHAIPYFMKNRYGRVINISSIGGQLGLPGQANYAASKAGQVALSKAVSKEVAKKGITINNVCPGFIDTELIADLPADQVKEYKKQVPMKRFGKVDEVANAVLFLASEQASYITGSSLEVTGGL